MTTTNIDRPILTTSWTTRARTAALVFAAVLIAAPLLAQRHAQPRSGGSGGGGGNSGGGHRSAGPSASAPSSRGGGGGGSWDGGSHRPPGSGGGAPHRPPGDFRGGHGHGHGHGGSYYYPYYYPYYGFSFGFGYGYPYYYGYSPYSYGYYPYYYGYRPYSYGYRPYSYPPAYSYGYNYGEGAGYVPPGEATPYYDRASLGAVAVRVKPKSAQVYVDGNYAGAAGSFDGFPGYLWIPPGNHRIEVVQVGYANLTAEVEVGSGQVVELDQNLERGESVRPEPPSNRYAPRDGESAPYRDGERAPYPENDYRAAPPLEPREPAEDSREQRRFESADMGGLFLEVRPDDASVYLDGRFVGTGRDVSTATDPLQLMPGEHRLQVLHPNYSNQERTIEIGAGEEKRVEVFLGRGGSGV